jgi:hypothetical protein
MNLDDPACGNAVRYMFCTNTIPKCRTAVLRATYQDGSGRILAEKQVAVSELR